MSVTYFAVKKQESTHQNLHFVLYMHLAHLLCHGDRCLLIWISNHIARLLMAQ